ncbi:helix-turn-helix transcriptional regulator [Rhizobium sp. TRM95796]|uniref:helix-turn-helix transcriptional regulator n=1 Tax=Rhizobium sp. TRM95796 TaxID=2979862 RepID=UPI0021E86A04|nr:helix-turn-helix transcriptional regulator [Rhizobium sp. TRM95796]MCV3764659.1 helix-turn-helix domain-containing protein [Rhizobium sp. TRM95796]
MAIDTAWFHQQLEKRGSSVRGLARHLGLDASAVSRMLNGERKMSADEQDRIAEFLSVSLEEVASHRRGRAVGFSESKQSPYSVEGDATEQTTPSNEWFSEKDVIYRDGKRWMEGRNGELVEVHRVFGCMKGTVTIMPGVDLTEPMKFEWSEKLYTGERGNG